MPTQLASLIKNPSCFLLPPQFLLPVSGASGNATNGTVYIPAFWRPKGVTDFESYKPVTVIGAYVFANMENITGIVIPPSVETIEQYAFYGSAGITAIEFTGDSTLKSIGNDAFAGCTGVDEITIPEAVTTIGKRAFGEWGSAGPQTIIFPFAAIEEAVSAWGTDWQQGNNAVLMLSVMLTR